MSAVRVLSRKPAKCSLQQRISGAGIRLRLRLRRCWTRPLALPFALLTLFGEFVTVIDTTADVVLPPDCLWL